MLCVCDACHIRLQAGEAQGPSTPLGMTVIWWMTMILRWARQLLAGMVVVRGSRVTAAGEGARSTHAQRYWLRSWCQASLYLSYLESFRWGERVMWIWLFRADVGIMYQVSVSIT
jgi:hypothetical protein